MELGRFELCLNVADLAVSLAFYTKLGFHRVAGKEGLGVVVVQSGDCRIGLYAGHIAENLLNFRGGNIPDLAEQVRARGVELE